MLILGIETSCDETAVAVVRDGREVLANVISSQIDIHRATGGVVPEVAARAHVGQLQPVLDEALAEAYVEWSDVDAIAVSTNPGLLTSLIVGTSFAASLAMIYGKPVIPVNHIKGHIFSNFLDIEEDVEFPVVVLTVSGGHNELVLMRTEKHLEVLGETLDDAAGEAYDKVGKMLGLPYPGGPEISRLSESGNPDKYDLPRPMLNDGYDFSFSGLKSAVRRLVESEDFDKADVAASFQKAINETLAKKLIRASDEFGAQEVHLAGGVSANTNLREMIKGMTNVKFRHPQDFGYCTDNAAMICAAAFRVPENEWLKPGQAVVPSSSFTL